MYSTAALEAPELAPRLPEDAGEDRRAGRTLLAVFDLLERADIRYCVTHGYEHYPEATGSDIDLIIDRNVSRRTLVRLLARNSDFLGADVVRCKGTHIVLAGSENDGRPCTLTLDAGVDCEIEGVPCYAGSEVLESRRRHGQFWVPAPHLEFGFYLAASIVKSRLDEPRIEKLGHLYRQDASGCERQVGRFWSDANAALILSALRSGEWAPVRLRVGELKRELRRRAIMQRPLRFFANKVRGLVARLGRVCRPDGVYLVVLGPDGAGKSSVIDGLAPLLAGIFPRSNCYGFTPALIHHLRHGAYRENSSPHELPPRSYLNSVVRSVFYWGVYYTLGYGVRHLDLARSTLVLNDRHFIDVLVDPRRYRYGGPMWLVRLIWRVIPKPDLVVLLDAPAEVLQARKQEVPFQETERQRREYLGLVRGLPFGHVVDATQPRERVAAEVSEIVLQHLRSRIARRFGLGDAASRNDHCGLCDARHGLLPLAKD